MIGQQRVLGIIPARGGSKGVPGKNIRLAGGKPLIAWTIEAARASRYIDRIVITTDSTEIAEVASAWGCEVPFLRPPELAQDETPGIDPVLHMVANLGEAFDLVVLLQPTSPLRSVADIDGAIETCVSLGAESCVSVCPVSKSPYWMYRMSPSRHLEPILESIQAKRRQDLPKIYALNGAVYVVESGYLVAKRTFLSETTVGFEMPGDRSLDIDTELDMVMLETILRATGRASAAGIPSTE